ncbi:MAG: hypothetical protein HWN68_00485 [Desulfobacterales bacterium]|nr:hypothetical protein [Desulfobacterales bacterium]
MKHSAILIRSLVLAALLALIFASETYAYIDPGTGSYIIQLVIAAFFGGLFVLKVSWKKIKTFFGNLFSTAKKN